VAPAGSTDPAVTIAGGTDGEPGQEPANDFAGWATNLAAPLGYAAVVLLVAFVIARRRLERRQRAAVVAAPSDPDRRAVQRIEPTWRREVPDDEENMPRWLRPSVRAERFGIQQSRTRMLPAALRPVATPAASPGTSDEPLDLEALFAAKRQRAADGPPIVRDATRE
jgi:hypothetical protein